MAGSKDSPSGQPDSELQRQLAAAKVKKRFYRKWDLTFAMGEWLFAFAAWPLGLIGFAIFKWPVGWSYRNAFFAGAGIWLVSKIISGIFEYAADILENSRKPKRGGIYWFSETILGEITLVILIFGIPAVFFWILSLF